MEVGLISIFIGPRILNEGRASSSMQAIKVFFFFLLLKV